MAGQLAALDAALTVNGIEVNQVSTVFARAALIKHIGEAMSRSREIYVSERTGDWLISSTEWELADESEISLAQVVHQRLSESYCNRYHARAKELGLAAKASSPRTDEELGAMASACELGQETQLELDKGIER